MQASWASQMQRGLKCVPKLVLEPSDHSLHFPPIPRAHIYVKSPFAFIRSYLLLALVKGKEQGVAGSPRCGSEAWVELNVRDNRRAGRAYP